MFRIRNKCQKNSILRTYAFSNILKNPAKEDLNSLSVLLHPKKTKTLFLLIFHEYISIETTFFRYPESYHNSWSLRLKVWWWDHSESTKRCYIYSAIFLICIIILAIIVIAMYEFSLIFHFSIPFRSIFSSTVHRLNRNLTVSTATICYAS